jgi:Fur family transcriptional regulator, ferric uptake regulator
MQYICINMDTLSVLKRVGIKQTAPRKEVLKILSNDPMSAQEVHLILKEKEFNIDLVTVYRTLETFSNLNILRKTQFEDKVTRYELFSDVHHHHLVCIKCGIVEDVEVNEDKFIRQIENQSNFKVERHALEFFGFCGRCR